MSGIRPRITSVYARNLEHLVQVADEVEAGTLVGTVGSNGRRSACHLLVEIRHDAVPDNPLHLLEPPRMPTCARASGRPLDEDDRE